MKKILVLAAAFTTTVAASAQLNEKIIVKAGENVAKAISPTGYFRFEKFEDANFELKDGTKAAAKFNYHIANGEMQYIDSKGDTLALATPADFVNIQFSNTTFIYENKGWHEIVQAAAPGKLAKKIKIHVENDRKGGYGESAPTSSQTQVSNFTAGWSLFHLSYDLAILKTILYSWVDNKNNLLVANKKNALKLVPKDKQSKLEAFIDENNINFSKEDDLRKVLVHAGTL